VGDRHYQGKPYVMELPVLCCSKGLCKTKRIWNGNGLGIRIHLTGIGRRGYKTDQPFLRSRQNWPRKEPCSPVAGFSGKIDLSGIDGWKG
jgi:hypothetical protein